MGASQCCCESENKDLGIDKINFLQMLETAPRFGKFEYRDQATVAALKSLWSSRRVGGDVMKPVVGASGKERTRTNVLKEQIQLFEIEYLYGGGYYVLENVRIEDEASPGKAFQGASRVSNFMKSKSTSPPDGGA